MAAVSLFSLVESGDAQTLQEQIEAGNIDLGSRDSNGRTVLDLAVILGQEDITKILTENGEVNLVNTSGYSPLHQGAAWGRLECLKLLVVCGGADHRLRTRHGETARQLALRYENTQCVEYLDCVDARCQLLAAVKSGRDTLTDGERITGKWNKDDKSKVTALCNEKIDWLDHNAEATPISILEQLREFEERYQPHLNKLLPPPPPSQ